MSTFAIMYVAGKIAMTLGPWPSHAACVSSLPDQIARIDAAWKKPADVVVFHEQLGAHISRRDITLKCIVAPHAPKLTFVPPGESKR